MGSVPLVGLSTCGEATEPVATPRFADSFYRETTLPVEGARLHGGKPELSGIEVTADPITESALAILTRDDEDCMTIQFHIYLSVKPLLMRARAGAEAHVLESDVKRDSCARTSPRARTHPP